MPVRKRKMFRAIRRYIYLTALFSFLSFVWLAYHSTEQTGEEWRYDRTSLLLESKHSQILSNQRISHHSRIPAIPQTPILTQSAITSGTTLDATDVSEQLDESDIGKSNFTTAQNSSLFTPSVTSKEVIEITEQFQNISEDRDTITDSDDQVLEEFAKKLKEYYDNYIDPVGTRKRVFQTYYRPIRNQGKVNCTAIINNDIDEIEKAMFIMSRKRRKSISVEKYAKTKDCHNFKRGRGYIDHPLSEMERTFPLAFTIVVYKDVEQAERLLRAVYRPHNFYCIHVDMKTSALDRAALETTVGCFENVFISTTSVNVTWGQFSVLEAELACMRDLWQNRTWKYYINLTGQEFPLKTNRQIVQILRAMNGANVVDGTWVRAMSKYFSRWAQANGPPPHHIRPIKGSVHVAVNRAFVNFSLHDPRSKDFQDWLKQTAIPDETFFASLNHNPHLGIPGSFLGEPEEYPLKPSFMRYKNWEVGHAVFARSCAGKYVRHICILGVGDLVKAYADVGLFANKFHLDYQYLALDCLEEVLHELTWHQYLDDVDMDISFYEKLDYRKYHL